MTGRLFGLWNSNAVWPPPNPRPAMLACLLTATTLTITSCDKSASPRPRDDTAAASTTAAAPVASGAEKQELERLRSENEKLKHEIEELRSTPAALLAAVDAALGSSNLDDAKRAQTRLIAKFPSAPESKSGERRIEAAMAKQQAAEKEAQRVAALGFKALKISPTHGQETKIALTGAAIGRRWIADAYDSSWHYVEAERGSQYVTLRATVTSKDKDPSLPGVALYTAEGPKLLKVGDFQYRFARWDDYGTYLGNSADYRNDFSRTPSVYFSLGLSVDDDALRKRPLYVVATGEGCHTREYERFRNPPVSYNQGSCASLDNVLTVQSFRDGTVGILKRLD